jgi:hypothetical protein
MRFPVATTVLTLLAIRNEIWDEVHATSFLSSSSAATSRNYGINLVSSKRTNGWFLSTTAFRGGASMGKI